jgi:outer membrane protein
MNAIRSHVFVGVMAGFIGAMIGAGVVAAVPPAARIGYVTVPEVVKATTAGGALRKVDEARLKEVKPITDQLAKIQPKMRSGNATFEEREQFDKLSKRYAEINKRFESQFSSILKPFDAKLVKAIANSARNQGFSFIVDGIIATDSGLLLYADQSASNITKQVVIEFKKLP